MNCNEVKIIDNFLPLGELKHIQKTIFHENFPWKMPAENATCLDSGGFAYFNHFFFDGYVETCKLYSPMIVPILKRLKCAAPMKIKSLILFNKLFDKCDWHRDHEYEATTAILYLNSCNGGTELKVGDEIKFIEARENRIVIFPSQTDHRPCTSTDSDLRYVINFNYFQ
jgi:hypothetical protein